MRFKAKKTLALLLTALMTVTLTAGCGAGDKNSGGSSAAKEDKMDKLVLTNENAKLVGRTWLADNGTLWCALSGSGAEFSFTGKKLDIMIEGDNVSTSGNKDNYCRLAIYVDGERVVDDMLDDAVKKYTPIDSDTQVTKTVRVIKLSETAMSCMGIMPIIPDGEISISPTPAKAHSIEFIGDSITCGYGVDDEDENHPFKTSTEDVTRAYAFKTAQALDADYSMFSISGWGIISGWTGDGTQHPDQQIPLYYEKLGFSYGDFSTVKPQDLDWDFSSYEPELIVINLGTNDDSYCGSDADRKNDYVRSYVSFLRTVRAHNPNAHIICALGIMGQGLCPQVEEARNEYSQLTGDENISVFKFDVQNAAENGYASDWHPTAASHDDAATALTQEIRTRMGW